MRDYRNPRSGHLIRYSPLHRLSQDCVDTHGAMETCYTDDGLTDGSRWCPDQA